MTSTAPHRCCAFIDNNQPHNNTTLSLIILTRSRVYRYAHYLGHTIIQSVRYQRCCEAVYVRAGMVYLYLFIFLDAACSATDPASLAAEATYEARFPFKRNRIPCVACVA